MAEEHKTPRGASRFSEYVEITTTAAAVVLRLLPAVEINLNNRNRIASFPLLSADSTTPGIRICTEAFLRVEFQEISKSFERAQEEDVP